MSDISKEILAKLYKYCAYQDRCTQEVCKKLMELEVRNEEVSGYLQHLKREKFLDDKRYTESFVRGKFYYKKWGKQKIRYELSGRNIPKDLIDSTLESEINYKDYEATVRSLIEKKVESKKNLSGSKLYAQVVRFLRQKGYEWEIISKIWTDFK